MSRKKLAWLWGPVLFSRYENEEREREKVCMQAQQRNKVKTSCFLMQSFTEKVFLLVQSYILESFEFLSFSPKFSMVFLGCRYQAARLHTHGHYLSSLSLLTGVVSLRLCSHFTWLYSFHGRVIDAKIIINLNLINSSLFPK